MLKPAPAIIKKIMRHFGVSPAQTLYVGDMTVDAQAGRNARVRTLVVTTGSSTRAEIRREKPWRIISSLRQLKRFF